MTPEDYDALAEIKTRKNAVKDGRGTIAHDEARMGLPTFIWANRVADTSARRMELPADAEAAARKHLGDYADRYRLSQVGAAEAKLVAVHPSDVATVVTFKQEVAGVEVFRNRLSIVLDHHNEAIALGGYLTPNAESAPAGTFQLEAKDAVAFAFLDLTGLALDADALAEAPGEAYTYFSAESLTSATGLHFVTPARAKRVMFDLPDALVPAYYLELDVGVGESKESDAYAYVIAATNGRMLFRKNLTAEASYSYSVWADEQGIPLDSPLGKGTPHLTGAPDGSVSPYVAPRTVTLQNFPFSKNDPWLPDNATNTFGNNVMAYADIKEPTGFGPGDLLPYPAAPNSFARTFDPTRSPTADDTQRMASITQLFYMVNFLHDWFYDAGFDERAGNAQLLNYERGGVAGDPLLAEAQDYSGRNNANMATPADGKSPRMQMYLFDSSKPSVFEVLSPSNIAGTFASAGGSYYKPAFDLTGDVVLVDDGVVAAATETTAAGTTTDACEAPFANDVSGKIVLADRGLCPFAQKAANVAAAGAAGLIVAQNRADKPFAMSAPTPINLPSVMVEQTTGDSIKAQLATGVRVRLVREELLDRDGTVDNLVVAHEWGHYITNRLVGNSAGLSTNQAHALGEGWGDFVALLVTTRESDLQRPANDRYRGAYVDAAYATGGTDPNAAYYGFRRFPYSVDFGKNPLTLKHMQNSEALPGLAPLQTNGLPNAEVHNSGEVWATMLWECYVSLLQDTIGPNPRLTFEQAQERMKRYLVASLKITPMAPTILEARDAVLAVAYANDPTDYVKFQQAFARRGAGLRSQAPDRYSTDNNGVVESYISGNDVSIVDVQLAETSSKCMADGVLDTGDIAAVTVTVRNTGIGFLSATTATLTSATPGVKVLTPTVMLDPMDPLQAATAELSVTLEGLKAMTRVELHIAVTDPTLAFQDSVTVDMPVLTNFDELPYSTKTETVEAPHSVWSAKAGAGSAPAAWTREALDVEQHVFFGPSVNAPADLYLISPKLEVGDGDFVISFKHAYAFEYDGEENKAYDGGVVELSTDGIEWTDIGSGLYNVTLVAEGANPLAGRQAFGNVSDAFPTLHQAEIHLGTKYAGQTVQLRFRSASDSNSVALGWLVDDISVTSTNTPFSSLIPDSCSQ